jgi:molybdenum cofactor cytidylyltransferase
VQSFSVTLVHNEAHAQGQEGSVRAGLAALSGSFDAVFIVPSDQPLIGAGDLTELIGAFKKRVAGHVVVPVVMGNAATPFYSTS